MDRSRPYIGLGFIAGILTGVFLCYSVAVESSDQLQSSFEFIPINGETTHRDYSNHYACGWLINHRTGEVRHVGEIRHETKEGKSDIELFSRVLHVESSLTEASVPLKSQSEGNVSPKKEDDKTTKASGDEGHDDQNPTTQ